MKMLLIVGKEWYPEGTNIPEGYAVAPEMLRDELGFNIVQLTPEMRIPPDVDLVISRCPIPSLVDLNKKVKLIFWISDVHIIGRVKEEVKEKIDIRKAIFERSDRVISSGYSEFKREYPQFINKVVFSPRSFGPILGFCNLKFNRAPKMKCLMSGRLSSSIYPLRNYIKKYGRRDIIDIGMKLAKKHRKKGMCIWKYAGDDYPKWLNSYFCCVTSSSIFNYVVGKYFEIPATGSLLLANETEDSKRAGFIPYVHFIPITKKNAISQIKKCLKDPKKFDEVRKAGMKFVRENHSVNNRFEQFKKIIEEVLEK